MNQHHKQDASAGSTLKHNTHNANFTLRQLLLFYIYLVRQTQIMENNKLSFHNYEVDTKTYTILQRDH